MGSNSEFTFENVEFQAHLGVRCLEAIEYTILKHRRDVQTKDVFVS